ncbi:MAG: hypothetical protein ACYDGR_01210 [Candidatus Dormibacteria bacterium]
MKLAVRPTAVALGMLIALGSSVGVSATGTNTTARPATGPPPQLLNLDVKKEDIAKLLATDKRALYVDRVGLYSLREPSNLLQATLEISHFRSNARWSSEDFQLSVVGRLGSSVPLIVRLGSQVVYLTSSKGLTLAVWFDRDYMLTLAIRDTFRHPKELLRQSLAINP